MLEAVAGVNPSPTLLRGISNRCANRGARAYACG